MENCEYRIVGQSHREDNSDAKMTSRWQKFCLLMWKNYLLQWRHPFQTILEIAIPVLFSALLVLIRSLVTPDIFPDPLTFPALPLSNISDTLDEKTRKFVMKVLSFKSFDLSKFTNFSNEIVYSPQNDQLDNLFRIVSLMVAPMLTVTSQVNSTALLTRISQANSFVGVEFPDSYINITELPDHLAYSMRFPGELRRTEGAMNPLWYNWRTDFLFPMFQPGGARNWASQHDGVPSGYYVEGFLFVQNFIFTAFAALKNSVGLDLADVPNIVVNKFPYPPFVFDILLQGLQTLVSLFIMLSFVYPCINIIKYITTEKEKQLKEAMKIMGLDSWLHWTAWFVKCFIYMSITVTLMVCLLKIRWYGPDNPNSVFTHSSASALWFFLLIYAITTIMFCFMLSVFFSKANTASAIAGLVWFMIYSPYTFIQQRYDSVPLGAKIGLSLFSNTAMALGFNVVIRYEGTQEGLQWNNIFTPVSIDDHFHLGFVLIMLVVDAFIYLLVALYIEKIYPGSYGVPEKWYFPFSGKFWCNTVEYVGVQDMHTDSSASRTSALSSQGPLSSANFEVEPKNKIAGVQTRALRKVYDNNKVAVEGLSMNFFENQITVLLGHNGAGKTTTMSMLTGMISPTSGTAIVNGKDIRRDINAVRSSIGLCPQHNILFDDLTVREHIEFFSRLKGLERKNVEKEVEKYVRLLKLENKIDAKAGSLSGGMKRKLSVGIALCANSKVVLFDEPSSGVDPSARRALWDLLQQEKEGRTVLLSTHHMDEADVLGDRIAIMSQGKLRAVGSSFFLKKQFGVGYHLVCVKKARCDTSKVTDMLRTFIPDIRVETDIGTELSYLLDEQNISVFQTMLQTLEKNSEELNIESYGISLTTLEEVFLKVGSDNAEMNANGEVIHSLKNGNGHIGESNGHNGDANERGVNFYNYSDTLTLLLGFRLYLNQFLALMEKKMLNTWRNVVLLLIQILIPVIFIIITIVTVRSWGGNRDLPKMTFSLNTYEPTMTTIEFNSSNWVGTFETKVFENYRSQFTDQKKGRVDVEIISDNMTEHYLKKSKQFLARVNRRYLYGVTISRPNFTVWYNNQPYHASPISLSLLHNAILRTVAGRDCSISVSNKPLAYRTESRMMMLQAGNNLGFQLSFNVGFAMAFVASFFVIGYIKERITKAKLLQFVSGVNVLMYWITAFLWDYFTFLGIAFLVTLTIGVFQEDGFSTFEELGRIYLVLIMFGFSVIPVVYIAAFFFNAPASGFTKMSIIFIFLGVAMYTVVFSMRFEGFGLRHVADTLTWIFLTVPHFSLSNALSNINMVNVLTDVCKRQCTILGQCGKQLCKINPTCCRLDFFDWQDPGILRNLVYFLGVGIGMFAVLFLIEFRVFEVIYYYARMVYRAVFGILCKNFLRRPPVPEDSANTDIDVKYEKERINAMMPADFENYNLVMKNVSRYYNDFLAVNQLCVGIKHSECFGLLGVNGAGKTSTFKMLTGDIKISHGDSWVQGISLKTNMKEVHRRIGYCPQFDALIDDLTGRETLKLFALSRGIPRYKLQDVIDKLSSDLNFAKHLDKQVKAYSGGNKRKLSTAVALLGNPVIIYLDEPTTGMDPGAKRNLWDVMCNVRDSGKTIVLTSHSMEECEALCTRLAIMVNGEFKCLGNVQHLKNKFGEGFVLTLKLKRKPDEMSRTESQEMSDEKDTVKDFIRQEFPDAVLKEEYYDMMTFNIPSQIIKWSSIFGILESAKDRLNIDDYSIGQSSLEQIFLSFTKYQRASDNE